MSSNARQQKNQVPFSGSVNGALHFRGSVGARLTRKEKKEQHSAYLDHLPRGESPSVFRASFARAGLLLPRDVVHFRVAARWPDQPHPDVAAVAAHTTHVETGLGSLAPARTSPDVGFNERSLLSLIVPITTGLRRGTGGRCVDELSSARTSFVNVIELTVRHVVGAVKHLGGFARRQTPAAVHRHRLHLQEVLALELEVLQLVARLVLKYAKRRPCMSRDSRRHFRSTF